MSNGGLPKTTGARGRATCPLGHAWKAIRVSGWRWATARESTTREPVEHLTYAPADCPSCGQAPRTFKPERSR